MAYRMQDRINHAGSRFKVTNSETVTLSRDGESDVQVTASPIQMEAEDYTPDGSVTRVEYHDWVIDVADYAFASVLTEPTSGDTITRANGDVYRPVSFGGSSKFTVNEPIFKYTTSDRLRYRVHTILSTKG